MEKIKNSDLDVDEELQFLREGGQWAVEVCNGLKEVVDTNGRIGWFGRVCVNTLEIEFEAFRCVDNVSISGESDYWMLEAIASEFGETYNLFRP